MRPDYSRPPPGYLPTGQRLAQPESQQPNSQSDLAPSQQPGAYPALLGSTEQHHYKHRVEDVSCIAQLIAQFADKLVIMHPQINYIVPFSLKDNNQGRIGTINVPINPALPTQLGVVPQYPPRQVDENNTASLLPSATNSASQSVPAADPPEEGRLVRVGNMLQIVPET